MRLPVAAVAVVLPPPMLAALLAAVAAAVAACPALAVERGARLASEQVSMPVRRAMPALAATEVLTPRTTWEVVAALPTAVQGASALQTIRAAATGGLPTMAPSRLAAAVAAVAGIAPGAPVAVRRAASSTRLAQPSMWLATRSSATTWAQAVAAAAGADWEAATQTAVRVAWAWVPSGTRALCTSRLRPMRR
ncbi:hypothetical protein PTE30175_04552 [Pandoraea terrae]|uniref:Uncharacterized protein n=1 Tax=Pandoraea terrae TaxID=1537710 RepID=A0A5E4YNM1_9BURK|nr:hypothetical protein PTE30175_04552 [Pandoraea terrae]